MPEFEFTGQSYNNPVELALGVIGGKWKTPILWRLKDRVWRYNELHRSLKRIAHKMLTQQLRELESDGLITRTVHPVVPPHVDYEITELGLSAIPAIDALRTWGDHYRSERQDDQTSIFRAIAESQLSEVRNLLVQGADLEETADSFDYRTPLLLALSLGHLEIARLLLEHGADPSNDGQTSMSPIHEACASHSCLRLLLEAGADPNRLMEDAISPLMLVSDNDLRLASVELLLNRGADPSLVNKHGETALSIAEESGADAIAETLRRHL